jgi:hypothetical protein
VNDRYDIDRVIDFNTMDETGITNPDASPHDERIPAECLCCCGVRRSASGRQSPQHCGKHHPCATVSSLRFEQRRACEPRQGRLVSLIRGNLLVRGGVVASSDDRTELRACPPTGRAGYRCRAMLATYRSVHRRREGAANSRLMDVLEFAQTMAQSVGPSTFAR